MWTSTAGSCAASACSVAACAGSGSKASTWPVGPTSLPRRAVNRPQFAPMSRTCWPGADEVVDDAACRGRPGGASTPTSARRRCTGRRARRARWAARGSRAGGRGRLRRRSGHPGCVPRGGSVKPRRSRSRAVRSQPLGPRPAAIRPTSAALRSASAGASARPRHAAAGARIRSIPPVTNAAWAAAHASASRRGPRRPRASRARRRRPRSGRAATAAGRRARGRRAPARGRARARRRPGGAESSAARGSTLPASQRDCWLVAPSSDSGIAECTAVSDARTTRSPARTRRGGARRPRSARTSSRDDAGGAPR